MTTATSPNRAATSVPTQGGMSTSTSGLDGGGEALSTDGVGVGVPWPWPAVGSAGSGMRPIRGADSAADSAATASSTAAASGGHHRTRLSMRPRFYSPARVRARANTSSSIAGVSRPVKVFCWLTW